MEQLTQDGLFTSGSIPYGYRLEKRGRINKRNREVCDLTVDDDVAKIVQPLLDAARRMICSAEDSITFWYS